MDEVGACLDEEIVDEHTFIDIGNPSPAEEDDYVDILLVKETSFGFRKDKSLVLGNWMKCARLDAIAWILKVSFYFILLLLFWWTRNVFGFGCQTAYLSMIYFDRFLSRRAITNEKLWAIRLLAVACLSLAAKMEELKVPALSEFPVDDFNFESKVIQRMELLVLNTLEWKMGSTTPFSFIPYFISKLSIESPPSNKVSQIVELIWVMIRETNTQNHRPSVVAVATAILATMDDRLTRKALELKMKSISQCRYLELEEVISCYNLMQELRLEKCREEADCLKSPDLSPTQMKPLDCSENSSVTSSIASKRKRLNFSNLDEKCGVAEAKRPR
ncbi:cyclin-D5-2-like [Cucumis melo var. makuwa]|uniref:B-like cyclin n=1 Tax=Cucumis melo var. makuwa TaxID=1194695 RepID=A0A5D3D999_CUCMM|nr:cyclin-D5-2-like [Cucumis melo var. makuwa]TYK20147.1 cyclin-D5-2-like [Cucumis melo var. makuwa]